MAIRAIENRYGYSFMGAVAVSFLSIVFDVNGSLVSNAKWNYLPLLVVLLYYGIFNLSAFSIQVFRGIKSILIIFLLQGLIFSILAKLYGNRVSSFMSIFLPCLLLFFNQFGNCKVSIKKLSRFFSLIGIFFQLECIATYFQLLPKSSLLNFYYEKLYISIFAMCLCYLGKQKLHFTILIILYLYNFYLYPAAAI